jgi:methylenetetrahydrofolate dehydrogenase (NADP+)/methenyltetrahydrofolate cyclohydrolase
VIQVGDRPESSLYIHYKKKALEKLGGALNLKKFPQTTIEEDIQAHLEKLKKDSKVDGILLQLPLPSHLSTQKLLDFIPEEKDVDGLSSINQSKIFQNTDPFFLPCTPLGILLALKSIKKSLSGLNIGVLGRSRLVGRPLSLMLIHENSSLYWTHSRTKNFKLMKEMDIIISATGHDVLKDHPFKKEAIIVDVGIWVDEKTKKIRGDLSNHKNLPCGTVFPVPGGVGPLTVAALCLNVCRANLLKKN